jgi:hypothetical protein
LPIFGEKKIGVFLEDQISPPSSTCVF